jgi:hypothetical protein
LKLPNRFPGCSDENQIVLGAHFTELVAFRQKAITWMNLFKIFIIILGKKVKETVTNKLAYGLAVGSLGHVDDLFFDQVALLSGRLAYIDGFIG